MVIQVLRDNPLLLLFVVAAIGYPLGRLKIAGVRFGVVAVLFAGLAIGALDPNLKLPETLYNLGLVLFVYTVGLANGAVFFATLRRQGLKISLLVLATLLLAFFMVLAAQAVFRLSAPLTAGLFSGSLSNTPSLAAALEYIRAVAPADQLERLLSEPVVAFSLTYPLGSLGAILAINLLQRALKIDYAAEGAAFGQLYGASNEPIDVRTIEITNPQQQTVAELVEKHHWNLLFGRIRQEGVLDVTRASTRLAAGDLVSLVGSHSTLDEATSVLGRASDEHLEFDISQFDRRRVIVSNQAIAGKRLRDLDLVNRFGTMITRVRRGDVEELADGNTVLNLGDMAWAVVPRARVPEVSKFFGDSYRAVSEVDILTFSLGLALGLLLGLVPIPLFGGLTIRLGLAGGPLIVALVLGALVRTGPIVWELPYSANQTLRQIGLVLFLAGVGTRSGYALLSTLRAGSGWSLLAAGLLISAASSMIALWAGYRLLRLPMGVLLGIVAGLQTQSAVLGFAQEQSGNELPNIGYATVYPVAMIAKIILVQVFLVLFWKL